MIELIDYGGGNLGSITRCLERLGVPYRIATGDNPPTGEHPLVFPGVGAFGAAMANLRKNGLDRQLQQLVKNGTPYLGICIGLQVLFEGSEEAPGVRGLGLLSGQVTRFTQGQSQVKVPQIGWNWIEPQQTGWPGGHVYFVNSYYPRPTDADVALYMANYPGAFCAAVQKDNITAFQFHPEKSGLFGMELLRRWLQQVLPDAQIPQNATDSEAVR